MIHKLTLLAAGFIFAVIALAAGCNSHENKSADAHAAHSPEPRATAAAFRAELTTSPATIKAGEPTTLSFTVKDAQGAMAREMQIVHEKPMHLLIVSSDLAEFSHIHPTPQPDGTLKVTHTFPNGGDYKLYADFTPTNSSQIVEQIVVKVNGSERAKQPLTADTLMTKSIDGISVTLEPDKQLKSGDELMLNFKVADAKTGQPATNLQKYLGEYAHFVIISADLKDFLHAHPMSQGEHSAAGGHQHAEGTKPHTDAMTGVSPSEVAAHTTFPQAGLYKVWAQFQRANNVITVPFVLNVAAGEGNAASVGHGEHGEKQKH